VILLPIRHETWTLRGLPWVTFGIMAACALATLAVQVNSSSGETYAHQLDQLRSHYFEHPYLQLDKTHEEAVFDGMDEARRADLRSRSRTADSPVDPKRRRSEQLELERRERALVAALADDPLNRWGLAPARLDPITLLTSLFLHASWIHLLGSLLILYLVGPFVEHVWGRPLYALLYLTSGLVASAAWVYARPGSPIVFVGASGAISGPMGAFVMRYWRSDVRYFYSILFLIGGTFLVPGWTLLPIWFIEQLYFASLTPAEAGGVAFVAHAAGFGFGVVAALLYQATGLERRYVAPRIESQPSAAVVSKPALDRAHQARMSGEKSRALRILKDEAARRPLDKDVLLSLWDSAIDAGRPEQAIDALEQVIRLDLKEGDPGLAAQHWLELEPLSPNARLGATAFIKIGQALRESGHRDVAQRALRRALEVAGPAPDPAISFAIARASLGIDQGLTRAAARLALAIPGLERKDRDVARRLAGEDEQDPPLMLQK
jgi:membrane associated rhomboid family serine protease